MFGVEFGMLNLVSLFYSLLNFAAQVRRVVVLSVVLDKVRVSWGSKMSLKLKLPLHWKGHHSVVSFFHSMQLPFCFDHFKTAFRWGVTFMDMVTDCPYFVWMDMCLLRGHPRQSNCRGVEWLLGWATWLLQINAAACLAGVCQIGKYRSHLLNLYPWHGLRVQGLVYPNIRLLLHF